LLQIAVTASPAVILSPIFIGGRYENLEEGNEKKYHGESSLYGDSKMRFG
jgi:hypothetical protein